MPLISFIIPYYNAENTIIQTLHSIYNSGLESASFEVIIIDDCSTIPAADAIRSISEDNLQIIRHSCNKRQGAARNTGIRNAKGDYIAFVDSDDLVLPGITHAISIAASAQPDIVACQYIKHYDKVDKSVSGFINCYDLVVSGKTFCEQYLNTSVHFCVWPYIFNSSFLKELYFPFTESVFMEDGDWVARHLFYAKKIYISNSIIYEYLYRENSTVHSRENSHLSGWVLTGLRKSQLAQEVAASSPSFASTLIIKDARWNIEGAFKKLYTISDIKGFYQSITISQWNSLKKIDWPRPISIMINHKELSTFVLSIISPIYRICKRFNRYIKI